MKAGGAFLAMAQTGCFSKFSAINGVKRQQEDVPMGVKTKKPNVLFVFADQWRAQAFGYAGDSNVKTPNLDAFAKESINFHQAVSGCPVCTPYRASMLTGQYPLTHGLFTNDVPLAPEIPGLGDAFTTGGYDTAYIGKWHVDGHGRKAFIPPERRKGFDYWKVLECTHDYWNSLYYANDETEPRRWEGYDAIAQTDDAIRWIEERGDDTNPFMMLLSWGPPHDTNFPPPDEGPPDDWYWGAPEEFRRLYDPETIQLRPNVPASETEAPQKLAGYYAHCSALDHCFGRLMHSLKEQGRDENTIVLFASDHGDRLGAHGPGQKQSPYDESIRVPFLLRSPQELKIGGRKTDALIDAPDIMPTLLGLCGLDCPASVEGTDYSSALKNGKALPVEPALIASYNPSGYYSPKFGGREYRGLRTDRYTYVRDLNGPWLLFDNQADPYQMKNRINDPELALVQQELESQLQQKLKERGDEFLPAAFYLKQWGYTK